MKLITRMARIFQAPVMNQGFISRLTRRGKGVVTAEFRAPRTFKKVTCHLD